MRLLLPRHVRYTFIDISEPSSRCGTEQLFKAAAQLEMPRRFLISKPCFCNAAREETNMIKKNTHTHLMRFSQGLETDVESIRKKKKGLI